MLGDARKGVGFAAAQPNVWSNSSLKKFDCSTATEHTTRDLGPSPWKVAYSEQKRENTCMSMDCTQMETGYVVQPSRVLPPDLEGSTPHIRVGSAPLGPSIELHNGHVRTLVQVVPRVADTRGNAKCNILRELDNHPWLPSGGETFPARNCMLTENI